MTRRSSSSSRSRRPHHLFLLTIIIMVIKIRQIKPLRHRPRRPGLPALSQAELLGRRGEGFPARELGEVGLACGRETGRSRSGRRKVRGGHVPGIFADRGRGGAAAFVGGAGAGTGVGTGLAGLRFADDGDLLVVLGLDLVMLLLLRLGRG